MSRNKSRSVMKMKKNEKILKYIFDAYTGQEVMQVLSEEYPTSYQQYCPVCSKRKK